MEQEKQPESHILLQLQWKSIIVSVAYGEEPNVTTVLTMSHQLAQYMYRYSVTVQVCLLKL
jgi:hypothetical protein